MGTSTELLRYNGPLTPDRYHTFFNPNFCHVCKSANDGSLILCDRCGMISYCNLAHKKIDKKQHRNICRCIAQLLEGNSWYYTCRLTTTECLLFKIKIKDSVEKRINRPLCKYETDMLWSAKTCFICHRWSDLHTCNVCFSANFCSDHSQLFYKYHASKCKKLLIHYNFKINFINNYNPVKKWYMLPTNIKKSSSTLDFIGLNIYSENEIWRAKPWTTDLLSFQDYDYSENISYPLTIYYGMQKATLAHLLLKRVCVIHINLPYDRFLKQLPVWEVLFHLLDHEVREIIIIIVSPRSKFHGTHTNLDLCTICSLLRKTLIVRTYSMLYKNYVSSTEYEHPNAIIIFNLLIENLTVDCLTTMYNQECPLILTSMELCTAQHLITCCNCILDVTRPLVIKNKFRGLLPRIALDTGNIVYSNQYLVVYLKNSNEPVPSTSRI